MNIPFLPAVVAVVLVGSSLSAAVIHVDQSASGANDGSSWGDAYTSLREALAAATSGDEIWVAEGRYYPDAATGPQADDRMQSFVLKDGVELYGGFAGGESGIGQRDLFANPTELSGEIQQDGDRTNNSYHVVDGGSADDTAVLNGFVIRDGYADGSGNELAGAAYISLSAAVNDPSGPSLVNCRFVGNEAATNGGAVWIWNSHSTFINCVFSGNIALSGGALYLQDSDAEFVNCTMQGNYASDISSGGALFMSSSSPVFTNCLLWGNQRLDSEISWIDLAGIGNAPSWSNSLVQGQSAAALNAYGSDNLDGSDPGNDPRFLDPVDPLAAPTAAGDHSLTPASAAVIDVGQNGANGTIADVASRDRVTDGDGNSSPVIDLGAHEFRAPLYVDDGATGADDGSSWGDAFDDLQEALDVAGPGDEIWVGEGLYKPSELFASGVVRSTSFTIPDAVRVRGGFATTESHPDERDLEANVSELNGNFGGVVSVLDDAFHVVRLIGVSNLTELDGFTVTRGSANAAAPYNRGGGVRIEGGAPRVLNCIFLNNFGTSGAGAHVQGGSAARFIDCRFLDNEATSSGGGMSITSTARVGLNRCHFEDNTATSGGGTALSGSSPLIINTTYVSNSAQVGGGSYQAGGADAEFINVTFHDNTASNSGGALRNEDSAPTFTNVLAWANEAMGSATTTLASISDFNATPTYSHSLLQNFIPPGGGGNLDGTNPANNPRFRNPADGSGLVTEVRLQPDSPVIDAGDSTALDVGEDFDGAPRVVDGDLDGTAAIDLGAYEFRTPVFVGGDATSNGDGSSWEEAFVSLNEAFASTIPGDTVWIAEGTYVPTGNLDRDEYFRFPAGVRVYGGFPDAGGDFTSRDIGAYPTILSGVRGINVAAYFFHAAVAVDLDRTAFIDGLTFRDGNANGLVTSQEHTGGGLYVEDSTLTVFRCRFLDNLAEQGGGLSLAGGAPRIVDCDVEGNDADLGGGVFLGNTDATLINCRIRGNTATDGGGVHFLTNTGARLLNPVITGNSAASLGGGLHCVGATPELINATIAGNECGGSGGGVGLDESSAPTFRNTIIWNNEANNSTGTKAASLFRASQPIGSSTAEFHDSLVENFTQADLASLDGDASGNLNGNLAVNNPDFVAPVDPALAPSTGGDYRLGTTSPLLDLGDDSVNDFPLDAAGVARVSGAAIDLGAFEGGFSVDGFAGLFPGLSEAGDENDNGFSNYVDYATGADPTAPHDPAGFPTVDGAGTLVFGARDGVSDVSWSLWSSETLLNGSWSELAVGVDYTISSQSTAGVRTTFTLDLTEPPGTDPVRFYEIRYASN